MSLKSRLPDRSRCGLIPATVQTFGSTKGPFRLVVAAITDPLEAGRHSITIRVDTKLRPSPTIRVDIVKPQGSSAEFTIVGGH